MGGQDREPPFPTSPSLQEYLGPPPTSPASPPFPSCKQQHIAKRANEKGKAPLVSPPRPVPNSIGEQRCPLPPSHPPAVALQKRGGAGKRQEGRGCIRRLQNIHFQNGRKIYILLGPHKDGGWKGGGLFRAGGIQKAKHQKHASGSKRERLARVSSPSAEHGEGDAFGDARLCPQRPSPWGKQTVPPSVPCRVRTPGQGTHTQAKTSAQPSKPALPGTEKGVLSPLPAVSCNLEILAERTKTKLTCDAHCRTAAEWQRQKGNGAKQASSSHSFLPQNQLGGVTSERGREGLNINPLPGCPSANRAFPLLPPSSCSTALGLPNHTCRRLYISP